MERNYKQLNNVIRTQSNCIRGTTFTWIDHGTKGSAFVAQSIMLGWEMKTKRARGRAGAFVGAKTRGN